MTPLWCCREPEGALVMLPGVRMRASDMVGAGLPEALAESGRRLDLFVPEPVYDVTLLEDDLRCLAEAILPPLRARYRRLWLGGISLGGWMALVHAQRQPDGLEGLCLLAPYPGSRLSANAIARAGGLEAWRPTPAQAADPEFQLWLGLREGRPALPAYVGIGRGDRFAAAMHGLARRLPRATVEEVAGGHDWDAWLPLWRRCLAWTAVAGEGA
jgi:pimeloyl-ACP methyl ester carboxylesterase